MHVVVAFQRAGAGGGDEGLEEGGGAGVCRDAETGCAEVGEEAFEEANLRKEQNVSLGS